MATSTSTLRLQQVPLESSRMLAYADCMQMTDSVTGAPLEPPKLLKNSYVSGEDYTVVDPPTARSPSKKKKEPKDKPAEWPTTISTELIETETDYVVRCPFPSVTNIIIAVRDGILSETDEREETVIGGILVVQADRLGTNPDPGVFTADSERPEGRIRRQIWLPSNSSSNKATATYKDGVLSIDLPKVKAAVGFCNIPVFMDERPPINYVLSGDSGDEA